MSAAAPETPETELQGTVDVVTYHDEESLWTVLRIAPDPGFRDPDGDSMFASTRLTAVGQLTRPCAGLRLRLRGRWGRHSSHGRQFEFDLAEELPPLGRDGLVRYLASKQFEGIGPKLAERIVARLGPEALDVACEDPERLKGIPGLTRKARESLAATLRENRAQHRLLAFLRGAGLGPRQSAEVLRRLGAGAEDSLRHNPYLLAEVPGLGFRSADRAALRLGLPPDGPERLGAALRYALEAATGDGHVLLPLDEWRERAARLVDLAPDDPRLAAAIDPLLGRGEVVLAPRPARPGEPPPGPEPQLDAWLPGLRMAETRLAEDLGRLLARAADVAPLAGPDELASAEAQDELVLNERQRAAVLGLLAHPVGLLTGGPGVGKTTIVRLVVELARRAGARVKLASPTGRAAKRLSEATGEEASTIHRLLGFEPHSGTFARNEHNPLEADLLVVDEISMLDVPLAGRLLRAIEPPTRVVLVGDPDQLPSVGPGQVLHDLLSSECVPVWRLTHIYRQRQGSLIVRNAHAILRGEMPELPPRGDLESDFYLFQAEDPARCADLVVDVAVRRIPRQFGIDFAEGVQVLAPMYKGECGVDALNERLREALGVGGRELRRGDRRWRLGDRVIHTRNDYEKGVFNGDVGRIVEVGAEGSLVVRFPEQDVAYASGELADLQPAFAMTVHRSQGGEYPAVVVPLVTRHRMMLQRNLLYTAVTRARHLLVLVGSTRALQMAIDNDRTRQRHSRLSDLLRAVSAQTGKLGPQRGPGGGNPAASRA